MKDFDAGRFARRVREGGVSRREFNRVMAALGVVTVGAAVAPSVARSAAQDHPLIFTWVGYDDENLYPPYVDKYGAMPRFAFWGDEEEGVAKLVGGFEPDMLMPCSYKVAKWWETGKLGYWDTDRLSNWGDILPSLKSMPAVRHDGNVRWVPADWGQTSVLFRHDLAPEYKDKHTWEILWDPKYKGRVAVFDSLVDGVVAAAIVEGVSDPFDYTNDETLAVTRERMRALVQNVRFFSNDPTTIEQGIASGELVAATTWNESWVRLTGEGHPVTYMNPKEGAMTWVCGFCITRDTPHRDKVHEVLDAFLSPASRAYEIREFGYGVSTQGGFNAVDEETLASLGLSRNPDDILSNSVFQVPIKGEPRLQAMFDEVKAGL